MKHINIVQTVKQLGHNANVRKQEEEIVVGIVLVIVRRGEVAAGPCGVLETEKGCVQNRVAGTRKQKQYVTGSWVGE